MSLFGKLMAGMLPIVPKPIVRMVSSRYVAGETLEEALASVEDLNEQGASATIDILGEEVDDPARAEQFTQQYIDMFAQMGPANADVYPSVKLTMLGLKLDEQLCRRNLTRICEAAKQYGTRLTIDMEDHSVTDITLELHREMLQQFGNVGTVLQAYMKRTLSDIDTLPEGSHIRICKGIYIEPEEIAYKGYQRIRDNYIAALERLFDCGHYTCIATHDEWLVDRAEEVVKKRRLKRDEYEFQMLLGVTPALRQRIIDAGHEMRVYVPYGVDWYPYSIRRLRENPEVAKHIVRAFFKRG